MKTHLKLSFDKPTERNFDDEMRLNKEKKEREAAERKKHNDSLVSRERLRKQPRPR